MFNREDAVQSATLSLIDILDRSAKNAEVLELSEDQKTFQLAINGHLVTVKVY